MGQTPPLKEISSTIKERSNLDNKALIINSWTHGWIKYHAILRYLPGGFIAEEIKDKSGGGITIDSCKSLIENSGIKNIWFIQPNRFPTDMIILMQKSAALGFKLVFKQDFNEQSDFDLWFKRKINNITFLQFKNNNPQKYIYTIYNYIHD